jgi:TRAP-type C4-dicarboxylate transport system substrate-binding protein
MTDWSRNMTTGIGRIAILASVIFVAACSSPPTGTQATENELPAGGPGASSLTTQMTSGASSLTTQMSSVASSLTTQMISVESIPPGLYSRVILRDEAIADGFDPELVDALLGPDGELPEAIEITLDGWLHHVTNDAGFSEVGDLGTYSYDEDGRLVMTAESTGCPGCVAVLDWVLTNGVLTLKFSPVNGPEDPYDEGHLLFVGDWILEGSTSADEVVTLNFANTQDDLFPQIQSVLVKARDLAGGSLDFEPSNRYGFGASGYSGAEGVVVEDIRSGAMEMGWVGARALAGFEPLLAPMLVDSYELQSELFERGIPQGMFADPDLQVIAVLPGPMRKIMGVDHAFLKVEDFAGQTIAGDSTTLAEDTMGALGVASVPAASGMSLDGLDGLQAQLAAISGNGYETIAHSVTANLNLWPRPLVIIMNKDVFDQLTPDQQDALMTAGRTSVAAAMEASLAEDEQAGVVLCASDLEVLESTTADLAAIFEAVQPVYENLEGNPEFAAVIDEIRTVKQELAAPPATLRCEQ